ncbi:unnamed protein product [Urochloa humidicola]
MLVRAHLPKVQRSPETRGAGAARQPAADLMYGDRELAAETEWVLTGRKIRAAASGKSEGAKEVLRFVGELVITDDKESRITQGMKVLLSVAVQFACKM